MAEHGGGKGGKRRSGQGISSKTTESVPLVGATGSPFACYQHDARYPRRRRSFIAGDSTCLETKQLAMVGSRQYSLYCKQWGDYFASQFAAAGLTITSGLALGTDGVCHCAALAAEIVAQEGALVSEFLPHAPPLAMHFPFRNRLISGLSLGVLVVESAIKSGSLVTARCALDQGREIFALSGLLGSPSSSGTHWLIQQGATLISRPEEIFEHLCSDLKWLAPKNG